MRMVCLFILLVMLFPASSMAYPGRVEVVLDGDTLELSLPHQSGWLSSLWSSHATRQRVRLYGIDCPEKGQAFGPEAAAVVRHLEGQTVEVTPMSTDRYGRTVALIHLESGELLQESLLRKGAAWVYARYCSIPQCLGWKGLEQAARQQRRGLWKEDAPLEPWVWRRGNAMK